MGGCPNPPSFGPQDVPPGTRRTQQRRARHRWTTSARREASAPGSRHAPRVPVGKQGTQGCYSAPAWGGGGGERAWEQGGGLRPDWPGWGWRSSACEEVSGQVTGPHCQVRGLCQHHQQCRPGAWGSGVGVGVGVLWGGVATDATFAAASFYRTTHTSVVPCHSPPVIGPINSRLKSDNVLVSQLRSYATCGCELAMVC